MPIHEFGYRHWRGRLLARWWRFWPITSIGVRLAFNSRMLRRMLLFSWMPLLYFGPLFFAVGSFTEESSATSDFAREMLEEFMGLDVTESMRQNPQLMRPAAWSLAFYYFLGISQSFVTMLVVAVVGPGLIAHDVRGKAFLLYFSKPITRWDYLLGKVCVLLAYIALVTLLPALALYVLSIGFAPSLAALSDTVLTVWRIVAASAVIAVPSTLLMLVYSSLSGEPRFAGFAWIATWLLGELFYAVLAASPGLVGAQWPTLFSIRQMTLVVIESVFNVREQVVAMGIDPQQLGIRADRPVLASGLVLGGISLVSLVVLWRRITRPLNV